MQTSLTIAFADGEYTFRLALAQINEIQTRCNAGIGAVFARIAKGRFFRKTDLGEIAIGDPSQAEYRIEDLVSVIRQGLIGGGRGVVDGVEVKVDAPRAEQLIKNYVLADGCPLEDAWTLAYAILTATIVGYEPAEPIPDADKKKAEATGA